MSWDKGLDAVMAKVEEDARRKAALSYDPELSPKAFEHESRRIAHNTWMDMVTPPRRYCPTCGR